MIFLVLLFLVLCFWFSKKMRSKTKNLPKGPPGIPFFGNLLQLIISPHRKVSSWANQYGNVYTINIFGQTALVVNDVPTMKKILGTSESTGNLKVEMFNQMIGDGYGIFSSEGDTWQEVRKLTMQALRECGVSRSSIVEPIVIQETDNIIRWLESKSGNVIFPIRETFIQGFSNISWNIFSRGASVTEKTNVGKFVVDWVEVLQTATNSGLLFFPWLKYIVPWSTTYDKFQQVCSDLHAEVKHFLDEGLLQRACDKIEPGWRNLIDVFIEHWQNCKDPKSCFYGKNGYKHCFFSLVTILLGAGETTASTLNWLINYLIAYPQVQEKLYKELSANLGVNENPCLMDKAKFPYLEAVILETLRKCSLAPFGVIRKLLDNVWFDGYQLTKNLLIVPNIYHANHDKAVWGDPENFRPERFIDVDIATKNKLKENIATFQQGKRICPGEAFSKDNIFICAAKLFRKFEFHPVSGKAREEYMKPIVGYIVLPKQLGVVVKLRSS